MKQKIIDWLKDEENRDSIVASIFLSILIGGHLIYNSYLAAVVEGKMTSAEWGSSLTFFLFFPMAVFFTFAIIAYYWKGIKRGIKRIADAFWTLYEFARDEHARLNWMVTHNAYNLMITGPGFWDKAKWKYAEIKFRIRVRKDE